MSDENELPARGLRERRAIVRTALAAALLAVVPLLLILRALESTLGQLALFGVCCFSAAVYSYVSRRKELAAHWLLRLTAPFAGGITIYFLRLPQDALTRWQLLLFILLLASLGAAVLLLALVENSSKRTKHKRLNAVAAVVLLALLLYCGGQVLWP